jgi:predicted TIM-barrel fold metal-dependent hydrolase
MTERGRIDTHQHIVPPEYGRWISSRGLAPSTPDGGGLPKWEVKSTSEFMDEIRISTGILSVSTPGVHLGDNAEARSMARNVNEFTADVVRMHPDRFGFFATLTLPDVDGAIAEAVYAFDTLNADGVVLLGDVRGTYFGDPSWDPLMEQLNRRKAIVFIHPTDPPGPKVPGIPPYGVDFLLDTTRAAINYAKNGCLERYPDLKVILSHAGGFIPYAAARIAHIVAADGSDEAGIARLRRFYFDTALSTSPYALPCLLAFADPTHITYGSDWPFAPRRTSMHFARMLDGYPLTDAQRHAITRGNAEKLLPRFAKSGAATPPAAEL